MNIQFRNREMNQKLIDNNNKNNRKMKTKKAKIEKLLNFYFQTNFLNKHNEFLLSFHEPLTLNRNNSF